MRMEVLVGELVGRAPAFLPVPAFLDGPWSRNHRVGLGVIVASSLLAIGVAACGPSMVALRLGPRDNLMPPWYLPSGWVTLSEWVAVPLLWLGLILGLVGLWVCWRAIHAGWRPHNRKLFALGAVLSIGTSLVPPMTSADVLMYAAYGRLQVLGLDPYSITPAEIFRQEFDPVLVWTERPWQDTPSVYGPIASASQWLAAWLGNGNMHNTVFWLQMWALLPFLLIGAIAVKLAHDDKVTQTRAVLFTVLNPLMIWSVLSGAHNEALTLVFAIVGLWFIRRSPFVAGIAIGLAGAVKVSLVFYGLAMIWGYRRDWRKLLQLAIGALIPLGLAYGIWVPRALTAASRNTGYISSGSWAPPIQGALSFLIGHNASWAVTVLIGWLLMVAIGWMLSRVLPWRLVPGNPDDDEPRRDPLTITVRTATILTTAWLVSSPYTLSWYDLIAWVPLGLMTASRLDLLMMGRGFWLAAAYVTGRAVEFSPAMRVVSSIVRDWACAAFQILVLVAIIQWWWSWGHQLPRWLGRILPAKLRTPVGIGPG